MGRGNGGSGKKKEKEHRFQTQHDKQAQKISRLFPFQFTPNITSEPTVPVSRLAS
jgi:hypothetical protein